MPPKTIAHLTLASVLNAVIGVGSFLFAGFATNPEMQDVTMRIGYYVFHGIIAAALIGVFGPWMLARRNRTKSAIFLSVLPALLVCLAVLAFLTLDSWLQRTFD